MAMDRDGARSKLRDLLMTCGAVWLALAIAGISIGWLRASMLATAISFTVYVLLLGLFSFGTGPGRRAPLSVYLIAGILYPIVAIALLIMLVSLEPPEPFLELISFAGAGLRVGFEPVGGPDTPIEFYLPLWTLNLLGPIVILIVARDLLERSTSGES